MVEGYMDAITIYQAGFTNVVASLGTAFNENHARVLKSYADSAVLLFDSDEAGVKAVLRAIPVLKNAGLKVKVLQVTDAKDPDEYIKKFGPSAFGELLKTAKSHILFEAEQIQKNMTSHYWKIKLHLRMRLPVYYLVLKILLKKTLI